jgi:hypothetical protein
MKALPPAVILIIIPITFADLVFTGCSTTADIPGSYPSNGTHAQLAVNKYTHTIFTDPGSGQTFADRLVAGMGGYMHSIMEKYNGPR